MPGNPEECRRHAANCLRLAEQAPSPEVREHFLTLAERWQQLAAELESTQAFLEAMDQIAPKPSDPSASS
jgi:hypothetical protein